MTEATTMEAATQTTEATTMEAAAQMTAITNRAERDKIT